MAISTNQKPTIYRNLYENIGLGNTLMYGSHATMSGGELQFRINRLSHITIYKVRARAFNQLPIRRWFLNNSSFHNQISPHTALRFFSRAVFSFIQHPLLLSWCLSNKITMIFFLSACMTNYSNYFRNGSLSYTCTLYIHTLHVTPSRIRGCHKGVVTGRSGAYLILNRVVVVLCQGFMHAFACSCISPDWHIHTLSY